MSMWEDWQEEYRHGLVLIWPPDYVRGKVNLLRKRYDPKSDSICEAHISLSPPLISLLKAEQVSILSAALRHMEPFILNLGPVKTFLPDPCIYLDVSPRGPLDRLRELLIDTALFKRPQSSIYTPHMTISEFGTSGEKDTLDVVRELREQELPNSFVVDSVAWIVPDDDFRFYLKHLIPIGERQ